MFAAVGGSKFALKRQQIETWFVTVSGQNTSGLKAGHFKAQKRYFRELHDKCEYFCTYLVGRCIPYRNGIVSHNALQDVSENNGDSTYLADNKGCC